MEHDSEPSLSSRYGYEQRVSTNSRPAPPASNSTQYERRVEKYERHEQPASSRYTERRASHETVHRDRDDRSRVAETRAPKYDRCVFTLSVNLTFSFPIQYSRTCLGRPPLLPSKNGRSRQVVSHNRSYKNHVLPLVRFVYIVTHPGSRPN